ncbi:hypothetical protein DTO96_100753 [Ephemeroptericola cinctiostellae]|uniref:Uncharacterized protein n=1 Tax=Ephemeroptericola cinctiostellae TaxID=2268024 RepID=A0A345D9J8_9BURK|nr:hypothetical protein [Ephemeroptericola cinctiostellae]AXF85036.1 hypothetical protein DTO96_100753 [Ephemeroptericola cinctiostellae]
MDVYKALKDLSAKDGVLIAAIPFVATLNAFVFEAGYLRFFGVPYFFIELNITHVITSSFVLIFTMSILFLCVAKTMEIYTTNKNKLAQNILLGFLASLPLNLIFTAATMVNPSSQAFKRLFVFCICTFLQACLITTDNVKKHSSSNILGTQRSKISQMLSNLVMPVLSLLVIFSASYALGFQSANKNMYWFDLQSPNMLFVGNYGDNFVFKRVDLDKKVLSNELLISNADNLHLVKTEFDFSELEK